jgi:hypothetical protein
MTERLQQALQHIDEIAAIIEDSFAPSLLLPSYAGAIVGMLPDDAEEALLRLRREASSSLPLEEQPYNKHV